MRASQDRTSLFCWAWIVPLICLSNFSSRQHAMHWETCVLFMSLADIANQSQISLLLKNPSGSQSAVNWPKLSCLMITICFLGHKYYWWKSFVSKKIFLNHWPKNVLTLEMEAQNYLRKYPRFTAEPKLKFLSFISWNMTSYLSSVVSLNVSLLLSNSTYHLFWINWTRYC